MLQNATFSREKTPMKFSCETCSFVCRKESDYNRHLSTTKHKNATKCYKNATKNADHGVNLGNGVKKRQKSAYDNYKCNCGKSFKHHSSYYRHLKSCTHDELETSSATIHENDLKDHDLKDNDFKEVILMLLKENKDIQKDFIELLPYIKSNNITNSNNTISNTTMHNNQFNINMFLNEHCKNAMNLTEFIESLPITNETYDHTIENGLTKTITSLVVNGLNNMDILSRPIHCTDPARKTMYIKDNNVWEKDNELKLLLDGIKTLTVKQRTSLCKWQEANNGWDIDENLQTKMTTLVMNSMENVESNEKEVNKIVKAIGKNTYLTSQIKDIFSNK